MRKNVKRKTGSSGSLSQLAFNPVYGRNVPRKKRAEMRRIPARQSVKPRRVGVQNYSYSIDINRIFKLVKQAGLSKNLKNGRKLSNDLIVRSFSSAKSSDDLIEPTVVRNGYTLLKGKEGESEYNTFSNIDEFLKVFTEEHDLSFDGSWSYELSFDVLHLSKMKDCSEQEEVLEKGSHIDRIGSESDAIKSSGQRRLLSDTENDEEVTFSRPQNEETYDVFLFPYGAVVFWNFDNDRKESSFMHSLKPFMGKIISNSQLLDATSDYMEYVYSNKSAVKHDVIRLSTFSPAEKLAISYALAQSSLLSRFEWRLDRIIQSNIHVPQELAENGEIAMTRKEISKQVGKLFIERNSVNLESDILDTPPFFWENDEWDPVYEKFCKYLEHETRIDVLNRRLDCVHELLEVLQAQAQAKHDSRLEWIVIWLIFAELIVQVLWNIILKDILHVV
eukprot:maker-scaffold_9-snap-gene-4.0-mRNA-1 protein AED:0.27 eAED:0.29 QI:0/0/0/0.75/1/1/4/0/446